MQFQIQAFDRSADPGLRPLLGRRRTGFDHRFEGRIDADLEGVGPHRARQAARDMEPLQRNDPAPPRVDQIQVLVVARVRHRKDATGVAGQEIAGGERVHRPPV
jgi:hypothetical protein